MKTSLKTSIRKSTQHLLPDKRPLIEEGKYDIYPAHKLDNYQISQGFESLAEALKSHKTIIIDGYTGVFFNDFRDNLDEFFRKNNIRVAWKNTIDFLKTSAQIEDMISPFLGGNDPLFGKRTTLELDDFFDIRSLQNLAADPDSDINLIIGPGAALSG